MQATYTDRYAPTYGDTYGYLKPIGPLSYRVAITHGRQGRLARWAARMAFAVWVMR